MPPKRLALRVTLTAWTLLLNAVTTQVQGFQSVVVKGSRFMKMERVVDALMALPSAPQKMANHDHKGAVHAA